MSKTILAKTEGMSHEEWLYTRKCGIGGSDAAAACGLSRWKSPLALWKDKISNEIEEKNSESMYWGTVMEPILREEFTKRTGLKVEKMPYIFGCKEHPFMIADIDGIVRETDGSVSLLEIKTVSSFAEKEWADGGLPMEYYLQIQHYLTVCDLKKAYIAYLIGGNNFGYRTIEYDVETSEMLIKMEEAFWQSVRDKIQPEVTALDAEALAELYPKSTPTRTILPAEADSIVKEYLAVKQLAGNVKEQLAFHENRLKAMLKNSECGKTPAGYSVSWKSFGTKRLDSTRLKKEHPALAAEYTTETSCRKFIITEPKEATA